MDVTCDQCGAEYEFDESLLGDKGATVKCSNCNHVFRVLGRKEPGRPQLKLRFVSSGRVETLSSLRELQVRVKNGEVTADDELGRDGNAFRRLGDVPELAVFFASPASRGAFGPAAAGQGPQGHGSAPFDPFRNAPLQVSETSMPPTTPRDDAPKAPPRGADAAKRTMIGVGPLNPHIPLPPRVPHVPGALPSSIPAPKPSGAASGPGRGPLPAPTSNVPTNPNTPRPTNVQEPRPAPSSQAPTTHGTAPLAGGQPQPAGPQHPNSNPYPGDGPAIARPLGNTPRSLAGVTAGPSAAAPGQKPVKLYLSDDEAPPARATQNGSKIWLYAGVAVLLGGAGFVGLSFANKHAAQTEAAGPSAAPAAATTPAPSAAEATPTAPVEEAPAVTAPNAQAPVQAAAPKEAEAAAQPNARVAEPEKAAEPEKKASSTGSTASSKSSTTSSKSSGTSSSGSSSSGNNTARDPSDYSGWVARGDQLFSRGDLSGAQAAYTSALDLRATGSEAHSGLGFMLLASGKPRDAIPHFDRAASSGFAEANIGLGDAYKKLGQKSNAVEAYQNYLDRLPSGSKSSYARTQIESLKGGSAGAGAGTSNTEEPAGLPNNDYKPAGELSGSSNENEL